ncbi:sulfotransferase [Microbacterium sp. G2-8]|uniref:sulfotransferase family protein n=1 Tax=Microbacterium sp. G2-8 TaxID=2842454 RepID=UPI001C8A3152|nr:sulfotransferase [Microbacterium sp. G2-8]
MASSDPWADKNLIFVGGMHRSGTTILADILSSADDAAGLDGSGAHMGEGQFLQDVYPVDNSFGGVTRWAFDPRTHMTEVDAQPDMARRLWDAWSPWWGDDAQFLVEKSPLNIVRTRFLAEVFPQAKFVIVTRHPIAQSLAVHKWARTVRERAGDQFSRLVELWLAAHRTAQRDIDRLDNVRVVRFEHLVTQPRGELDRLSEFLGVRLGDEAVSRLDAGVLEHYATIWDRARRGRGMRYPGRGLRTLRRRAISTVTFPYEARLIEKQAEAVAQFGYDIHDLRSARTWADATSTNGTRQ